MRVSILAMSLVAAPLFVAGAQRSRDSRSTAQVEAHSQVANSPSSDVRQQGQPDESASCDPATSSDARRDRKKHDRQQRGEHEGEDATCPTKAPPVAGLAQIHGTVYGDTNGDGKLSPGEYGLAGITVLLTGPVTTSVATDANGAYAFTALPIGTYTVCVAVPAGARESAPVSGPACAGGAGWSLDVPATMADLWYGSIDFGIVQ
jgi:hypothetical protein